MPKRRRKLTPETIYRKASRAWNDYEVGYLDETDSEKICLTNVAARHAQSRLAVRWYPNVAFPVALNYQEKVNPLPLGLAGYDWNVQGDLRDNYRLSLAQQQLLNRLNIPQKSKKQSRKRTSANDTSR